MQFPHKYVEIRRPLATDTAAGFWGALLSQLDLDGIRIPNTPYEAAALAKEHLPLANGKLRLVIIDALGRAPELVDNEGLAGLDSLPEGVVVVIGTRPGRHLDVLAHQPRQLNKRQKLNRREFQRELAHIVLPTVPTEPLLKLWEWHSIREA